VETRLLPAIPRDPCKQQMPQRIVTATGVPRRAPFAPERSRQPPCKQQLLVGLAGFTIKSEPQQPPFQLRPDIVFPHGANAHMRAALLFVRRLGLCCFRHTRLPFVRSAACRRPCGRK
jgi:hypothetical protein